MHSWALRPRAPRVEHGPVVPQAGRDVVRAEDRGLARMPDPRRAHHAQEHPGNRDDERAAPGRRADRAVRLAQSRLAHDGVRREKRREVRRDRDRAHAGAAAAVRNAERLVQVDVAHVGPEIGDAREAGERVQVRAVEVDLAAGGVHPVADLPYRLLEHAVGRRVGEHEGADTIAELPDLRGKVRDVDVAVRIARDHRDLQPRHVRGRGIGPMRRERDQAHVAMRFAARGLVVADRDEAGVLAVRSGIGLERHVRQPGDRLERRRHVREHRVVTRGLLARRERMQVGEFRPRDRRHLGRGVQLHGAGAQAGSCPAPASNRGSPAA